MISNLVYFAPEERLKVWKSRILPSASPVA